MRPIRRFRGVPVLAAVVLLAGCDSPITSESPPASAPSTSEDLLLQDWTRAYEEEDRNSGIQVFRRTDSRDWGPSWFRMRYVFEKDGTCELLILHPADAHSMKSATWERLPKDTRLLQVRGGQPEDQRFAIVELTEDILRLQPLRQGPR